MVLNKFYIVGDRFSRFQDNLLKLQELRSSQIPREDINIVFVSGSFELYLGLC